MNKKLHKNSRKRNPLTRGTAPRRREHLKEHAFKKGDDGRRGAGRPPGAQNFITREVKEAIIAACNRYGRDGKGTGGLEGYLFKETRRSRHPHATAGLILWVREPFAADNNEGTLGHAGRQDKHATCLRYGQASGELELERGGDPPELYGSRERANDRPSSRAQFDLDTPRDAPFTGAFGA